MRLYELRREEKMREARTWVIRSFHPQSVEDFLATMKTDEYTYMRNFQLILNKLKMLL